MSERAYVITGSVAGNPNGSTTAFTRDGIQLEMSMRLVAAGKKPKEAWLIAAKFVKEMDESLPPLPPASSADDDDS